MSDKRGGWLPWLVIFSVVVVVGLMAMFFVGRRPAPGGRLVPRSQPGTAYMLIDARKYLLRDKDSDGRVDCLIPTGLRTSPVCGPTRPRTRASPAPRSTGSPAR